MHNLLLLINLLHLPRLLLKSRNPLIRQTIRMISHSDMRQADINRVNKAKEHLKAAVTILSNIKWENTTMMESHLIMEAKDNIRSADMQLDDITNIQEK